MYTFDDLQQMVQLSPKPVKQTLLACGLDPQAKQFSQQDVERFLAARQMFNEKSDAPEDKGKTAYERIAERFGGQAPIRQSAKQSTPAKSLTDGNGGEGKRALPHNISEVEGPQASSPALDAPTLQARTVELGHPLEFGDLVELLRVCDICVDADSLDRSQLERFDKAIELLEQGKSLTEIRQHFGLAAEELKSYSLPDLVETSKQKGYKVGYGQACDTIRMLGLDPNTREYKAAQAQVILKGFELVAGGAAPEEIPSLLHESLGELPPTARKALDGSGVSRGRALGLMDELARVQAEQIAPVADRMLLTHLGRELKEGERSRAFWGGDAPGGHAATAAGAA